MNDDMRDCMALSPVLLISTPSHARGSMAVSLEVEFLTSARESSTTSELGGFPDVQAGQRKMTTAASKRVRCRHHFCHQPSNRRASSVWSQTPYDEPEGGRHRGRPRTAELRWGPVPHQ
jgi:hypothetical protein